MRRLVLFFLLTPAMWCARLQTLVTLPPASVVTALRFDAAGNLYAGGYVKPVAPKSPSDISDGFIAKLSADGTQTFFRAVLGGSSEDQIRDIAISPDGSIQATGITFSSDFPVTAGSSAGTGGKGFYARFDSKGSPLLVTLLNGAGDSSGEGITVGNDGAVYITGRLNTPASGGYVTKFDAAGNLLFTSSLIGGNHIALDGQGNIYIAGILLPPSAVPTTAGSFQPKPPLPLCANSSRNLPCFHQYVSKLDPLGKRLIYSTFVAGTREETSTALGVDAQGNAYLAGSTTSPDYPVTPGAYQPFSLAGPLPVLVAGVPPSQPDPTTGFITKLKPDGAGLVFSTYLGGSSMDYLHALALDAGGDIYVAGVARSEDFPGFAGVPDRCASGAVVTRLSVDGSSLTASQVLYGVPVVANGVVALDASGKPWVAQGAAVQQVDLFAAPERFACATDGADFAQLSQVAPGQLITLFGDNLGLGTPVAASPPANGSYPLSLGGVGVTFNGTPAPLLYVSPGQVNVQVPFEVTGQASARMVISLPGAFPAVTGTRDFAVVDRAPSVFVLESGALICGGQTIGGWHPLVLNADGTVNRCDNPALRGSTVTILFQGAGVTSPPQSTGAVSGAPQGFNLALSGSDGTARFIGASSLPGVITGVWALAMQIPNGLTTSFSVGGVALRETTLVVWSK